MPTTPALYWFPVLVQVVLAAVIAGALITLSFALGNRVKDSVRRPHPTSVA